MSTKNLPDHQSLFRFWRAIEALTPQDVAKAAPADTTRPVYRNVKTEELMPWEAGHPQQARRIAADKMWRYTAQCVVYDANRLMGCLEDLLSRDENVFEARAYKFSRLFDVGIDEHGSPNPDTFALSMAGWAVGVVLQQGIAGLEHGTSSKRADLPAAEVQTNSGFSGFDMLQDRLRAELASRVATFKDAAGVVIKRPDRAWLDEFAERVIAQCRLPRATLFSKTLEHRCRCYQVKKKQPSAQAQVEKQEDDLLNSFFISDLGKLAEFAHPGLGAGLRNFVIAGSEARAHCDLRTPAGLRHAGELLAPAHSPVGRWPSQHALVFSQQVAVNALWNNLKAASGIFAVNGPPGTGKTTLLRDVVAAVVVERAMRLADVVRPAEVFGKKESIKVGDMFIWFHRIGEIVRGTGIVVASCNNGAVENVSLELPSIDAISSAWQGAQSVDYFQEIASTVLGKNAWALIAARLGNKTNRNDFLAKFWFGPKTETARDAMQLGMKGWLDALKKGSIETRYVWEESVARFRAALEKERGIRDYLDHLSTLPQRLAQAEHSLQQQAASLEAKHTVVDDANAAIQQLEVDTAELRLDLTETERQFESHIRCKPGFLEWLASLGKSHRRFREQLEVFQQQQAGYRRALRNQAAVLEKTAQEIACLKREITHAEKLLSEGVRQRNTLAAIFTTARIQLGKHWPQQELPEAEREPSAPWATQAWCDARTETFLAALELHRAFIEIHAETMSHNLTLAVQWLQGKKLPAQLCQLAFDSLTLVVPVLSTTFASVARMFADIGKEGIGWLLIDEAGQAMPQQAAGAIWRAQRTLVVGDPLQLEPVVVIPASIEAALAKHYRIKPPWWPSQTSVQVMADQASTIGTYLPGASGSDPIWVGAPLRVHRRCDEPMFSISNQVAYDSQMIYGKPTAGAGRLPPSGWIDIRGTCTDGHWIADEGTAVDDWLEHLIDGHHVSPKDIFLISPFRQVARMLKAIGKKRHLDVEHKVGTVHRAQGKEAEVVFLVLGGDPKKPGAKDWAAQKPNLLNVAASRAKQRLYVVGNKLEWGMRPHFKVAAQLLPTVAEGYLHREGCG